MTKPVTIRLSKNDKDKLDELADKVTQLAHECGIEITYERALTTAFWCAAYTQPSPIPRIAEAVTRNAINAECLRRQRTLMGNTPIAVVIDSKSIQTE